MSTRLADRAARWALVTATLITGAALAGCGTSASKQGSPRVRSGVGASPTSSTTLTELDQPGSIPAEARTSLPVPESVASGASPPSSSTVTPDALHPPADPSGHAYLGAWINPSGSGDELTPVPGFEQQIHHSVRLLHLYTSWTAAAPIDKLNEITRLGSIAVLDWACGTDSTVISGASDAAIRGYAQALRSYGQSLFLRYGWEMNLSAGHNGRCVDTGPGGFVRAWQRVVTIFRQVGAANVSFVWCPGISGHKDFLDYYPGSSYVDWIGVDGYDRAGTGASAFEAVFQDFYGQFASMGRPMMVAETGAGSSDQAAYLRGVASALPAKFPRFHAFLYFDAPGSTGAWVLSDGGLAEFGRIAAQPYFSG